MNYMKRSCRKCTHLLLCLLFGVLIGITTLILYLVYRSNYYEIVPGEGIRGVCLLRSFPTNAIQLPHGKRTPQKYLPCASPTFPSVSFALDPEKGVCPIEIAVDHNVAIKNRRLWMTKRRDPHLKNITVDDIIELFGPVPAVVVAYLTQVEWIYLILALKIRRGH